MSSMPDSSSSHTVLPAAAMMRWAASRSCSSTPRGAYRPATPLPIIAGVLGMMRTMRSWPSSQRDSADTPTPAAIDSTSAPSSRLASPPHTSRSCCGLTASTTIWPLPKYTGSCSCVVTPNCWANCARLSALGSTTLIWQPRALVRPAMMAVAILPPPMKVMCIMTMNSDG